MVRMEGGEREVRSISESLVVIKFFFVGVFSFFVFSFGIDFVLEWLVYCLFFY